MHKTKTLGNSAIVLFFLVSLEIMIMISPFAGFFYSVFNPFLLRLSAHPATKWLSAFFLPHMVVPPDDFLKFVRVMGSVLFVIGTAVFLVSALQVYSHKFRRKGAALEGLYSVIRHPQYAGLGITGIGLSILWPRFLVVVLWIVMILLYYYLSKDEERRMLRQYPDAYRAYMAGTGMFLPKKIESLLAPSSTGGKAAVFIVLAAVTLGGAFFLRDYTVKHLPIWTDANVSALAIMPKDMEKMEHRMPDIVDLGEVRSRLSADAHYLVYFLPANYIMQGLIADTGSDWKLYKQYHTISMITDWIFSPFGHLTEGPHAGHAMHGMRNGVVRRLIFLRIENVQIDKPSDLLSINARRVPIMMLDLEIHNMDVLDLKELPQDTGWGTVPTPVF